MARPESKLFVCIFGVDAGIDEPLTDDAGDELICSNIDAAVSSSGVHAGETGGERPLVLALD